MVSRRTTRSQMNAEPGHGYWRLPHSIKRATFPEDPLLDISRFPTLTPRELKELNTNHLHQMARAFPSSQILSGNVQALIMGGSDRELILFRGHTAKKWRHFLDSANTITYLMDSHVAADRKSRSSAHFNALLGLQEDRT